MSQEGNVHFPLDSHTGNNTGKKQYSCEHLDKGLDGLTNIKSLEVRLLVT